MSPSTTASAAVPPPAPVPAGKLLPGGPGAIPGGYVLELNDTAALRSTGVAEEDVALVGKYGGTLGYEFMLTFE